VLLQVKPSCPSFAAGAPADPPPETRADSEAAEDVNDARAADDDVPGGAPADAVIEDRRAPAIEAAPRSGCRAGVARVTTRERRDYSASACFIVRSAGTWRVDSLVNPRSCERKEG